MSTELQTKLKHYRINESEYKRICDLLGRHPQNVEWAIFSALWSEHCSYKSSKTHLKKFGKTITPSVVTSQGENAGIVDLGQGEKVVFKMESHNHPSFIEPYQGAATGVGGILRDIFTMGARPIASADFLCFGEPTAERMPKLVDGVVRGISGYGNCVGVPTVTGKTHFDRTYNRNILVNAMSVGLLCGDEPVALSTAKGPGNDVVYVGAKTGKDGVHGASMASESFDEDSESKRPNVQIGDPFFEKLLIESCLEVIQQNLVVAIQDMGAAGLTSSSFEMSAKAGLGFEMHLDRVPLRDSSMSPEDILLSESQERMLLICEPEKFAAVEKAFARWGLEAVRIGKVRSDSKMQIFWKNEKLTEIDPATVVDHAPMYERKFEAWAFPHRATKTVADPGKIAPVMESRLDQAAWGSRQSIYRQYDQRVGGKTAHGAEHEVALLRLPLSKRGLMIGVGCRPSWMKRDAWIGALDAVVSPVLQMAIKGAAPIGVTDCLNFGNPEKPHIMSEFVASVEAIRDISLALKIPVISGNVSFYNETQGENITSTPAVGVVGLRSSVESVPQDHFRKLGSALLRVEIPWAEALGEREWAAKNSEGQNPTGLAKLSEKIQALRTLCSGTEVLSSQLMGEGGLVWGLAKMASAEPPTGGDLRTGIGFQLDVNCSGLLADRLYQVVLEVNPNDVKKLSETLKTAGLIVEKVGETKADWIEARDWKIKTSDFIDRRQRSWRIFE